MAISGIIQRMTEVLNTVRFLHIIHLPLYTQYSIKCPLFQHFRLYLAWFVRFDGRTMFSRKPSPASRQGREFLFESHSANIHAEKENAPTRGAFFWRREWDSNPRILSYRRFSRPEPSTTRPSLRMSGVYCNINPALGQDFFSRGSCRKYRSHQCARRSPEDTGRCKPPHRRFRARTFCRWPADPFPFRPVR